MKGIHYGRKVVLCFFGDRRDVDKFRFHNSVNKNSTRFGLRRMLLDKIAGRAFGPTDL